ncbi:hypothetical protein CMV30_02955 [Nibricoccus aquaticus]|uniref:Uncharacterized protein n=1 Tax=Nibricoccus aquaticus TaxID=2576891 RepID=A0A290Q2V9_9BACT|nr:hypothetical protein [Nibricoccus aquaticus]ATC63005.1 hypothetical protein CMV30_02955 [Nibricoccus aquaticus]
MKQLSDEEIAGRLVSIISDGFNRSMSALEKAGAIDTKKMRAQYRGVGSKYYDIVTEQIELSAKYAAPGLKQLFQHDEEKA